MYADGFVARMVADFVHGQPDISVYLESATLSEIEGLVAGRQVDVAVTAAEEVGHGLEIVASVRRSAVCIFPAGDPLEACATVSTGDLQGRRFIHLTVGTSLRALVEQQGLPGQGPGAGTIEVATQSAIVSLVAQGVGVAIVDPEVVPDALGPRIGMRALAPPIDWSIVMITRSGANTSRVAEHFRRWSRERIPDYLEWLAID